jgi:hypothetical protein
VLAFAGVYFVALKPPGKGNDSPYNAPISDAQKAVVQSQVAAAKAQAATGDAAQAAAGDPSATPSATAKAPTTLGKAATPHPAVKLHAVKPTAVAVKPHPAAVQPAAKHHAPAAALKAAPKAPAWDRSRKVFAALAHHKIAVLLFWTKGGADDNSVRRAVTQVSKRHGVATFSDPMSAVGKYAAITAAIPITVSPTVLVIGPNGHYIPINGYTSAATILRAITLVRK